jgi:hypothetical protein
LIRAQPRGLPHDLPHDASSGPYPEDLTRTGLAGSLLAIVQSV